MPDRPPGLLTIGELAARAGVAPSALRYWERLGLLTPHGRDGLRRTYRPEALDRVALILAARATGFSLAEVADVLTAGRGEVRDLLAARCADLDARIAALTHARDRLAHALTCRAPSLLDCPTFREGVREGLPGSGGGGGTGGVPGDARLPDDGGRPGGGDRGGTVSRWGPGRGRGPWPPTPPSG